MGINDDNHKVQMFWAEFVQKHSGYNVDKAASELIQTGFNWVQLIKIKNEKLILRVSRSQIGIPTSEEDYLFELEFLDYLANHDLPVARPVKWKNNSFLMKTTDDEEHMYFCSLFEFAEGKKEMEMSDNHLLELGKTMAKIHKYSQNFQSNYSRLSHDIDNSIIRPTKLVQKHFKNWIPKEVKYIEEISNWLRKNLDSIYDELPSGLIHGDLHRLNVHFTEDNSFTIFDFDFMGNAPLALDIACFKGVEQFLDIEMGKEIREDFSPFFNGYNSIRQLLNIELDALPLLEMQRSLMFFGSWANLIGEFPNSKDLLIKRIKTTIEDMKRMRELYDKGEINYMDYVKSNS